MDTYTDEQCAQLMACKDEHSHEIYISDPVDAMTYIIDLMTLVGDNPLIAHWLAYCYGLKSKHHVIWYDCPQDMPSDYVADFMHSVTSADPEYRESIVLEMREAYASLSILA